MHIYYIYSHIYSYICFLFILFACPRPSSLKQVYKVRRFLVLFALCCVSFPLRSVPLIGWLVQQKKIQNTHTKNKYKNIKYINIIYHAIPCCPSYRQIFGLFLAVFLFFVVSQLSPTLYIRFYPDTTIEFTCFLFCTVFLSIIVPYIISTSKLQLSCPVCCAGSFSSLSTLSSHSSHTLSLSLFACSPFCS